MKFHLLISIFLLHTLSTLSSVVKSGDIDFRYISPVPGSKLVNEKTNIIIKTSFPIQTIKAEKNIFVVIGSNSGYHTGKVLRSGDNTVLYQPDTPFRPGERVTVYINKGISTENHQFMKPFSFDFIIRAEKITNDEPGNGYSLPEQYPSIPDYPFHPTKYQADTIPPDFPELNITQHGATAPGYIFMTNMYFPTVYTTPPYLMILENSGNPVFYRKMQGNCFDFKLQNNLITYFYDNAHCFLAMDSTYTVIDSFKCGNGYSTDVHELRLLPNGHALMLSYDTETVDMSQIIQDGDPSARVVGLVVQEIDQNKNVVFQWRSWDHFQITDATHENLRAHSIDYVHGNAIELDNDGNIIISSRHMDEITKIDRQTGQIIWRMGGENNQFTFINDPIGFSHQHAIRILDNGHFTLFDNGNFHNPPFSRAVEYIVDEHTKTVSLVWQFRHTPDIYGSAMGFVQRLPNGNTLIGWGYANPALDEVKPDGTVLYEISMAPGVYSYRAFRYELKFSNGTQNTRLPYTFSLAQNFPNPFNPGTALLFTLGSASNVKLTVYDMLGRKIKTLVDEYQQPGNHLYQFDGSNLASGIYFYVLKTDTFSDSKKMILVK